MGYPEIPEESSENLRTNELHLNNYGQNTSDDSDADDSNNYDGYQQLPLTDNGDEIEPDTEVGPVEVDHGVPNIVSTDAEIECEVWSQPRPQELGIELDNTRAEQIMNAMASITLPNSAIPEWAQQIPEEKWKQDLLEKIRQKREDIDKN